MKKLNNKGMTIIEILVCFIIVAIISSSVYATVTNYNDKKNLESNKQEIYKFKNLLTKEIYDDIIYKGLINVSNYQKSTVFAGSPRDIISSCGSFTYYNPRNFTCTNQAEVSTNNPNMIINDPNGHGGTRLALLEFRFRDNSSKILQIAVLKNTKTDAGYGNFSDQYYVSYGKAGDMTRYPLPELGETKEGSATLKDLSLEINELSVTSANILKMDLRFHHPDLEDKYGIKINVPINMDYYDR